jgi:hypothetical protein
MVDKSLKSLKRGAEASPPPSKKKARPAIGATADAVDAGEVRTRKRTMDGDHEDHSGVDELALTQPPSIAAVASGAADRASTPLSIDDPRRDQKNNPMNNPKNNPKNKGSTATEYASPVPKNTPLINAKQRMRIAISPTKKASLKKKVMRGGRKPVSVEPYFILGTHTDLHSVNAIAVTQHHGVSVFKEWAKSGATAPRELKPDYQMQFMDFNDVPAEISTAFGKQRALAKVSTVTTPAQSSETWCAAKAICSLLKPPDFNEAAEPFLLFAKFCTAETEDTKGSKAPNLRGTVESCGVRSDVFGWIDHVKAKIISKLAGPDSPALYLLTLVTRVQSRNAGYYELKLNSSCVIETEAYFEKHFSLLLTKFVSDHTKTGPDIKDDVYPVSTVFDVFANIATQGAAHTHFVRATIEVVEAGSALTSPGCGQPGCSKECTVEATESDEVTYTCELHGDVDPELISRPDATIIIKTQNNRHGFKDEDLTLECVIAKGQQEEFIGMTLDGLQEDGIKVDEIRDSLVGRQFRCTLAISEYQTVALRLVYTPVVDSMV